MMKILPSNEIREIEAKANQSGISYLRLMENAGSACAKAIRKKFDKTTRRNVTIVCGKGKNGGDGFVIARKLAENEYNVNVVLTSREPPVGDAGEMLSRIRGTDIGIYLYDDDTELCEELIVGADITVDAVFGTGFKGAADEKNARIFKAISKSLGYTVSIDIPSGIEADSGYVKGAAVKAQMTIAVMALKNSLVTFPAAEFAGNVIVVPIGIPEEIFSEYTGAYTLSPDEIRSKFPHRKENANKGDFGKGLIIAGSYDMPGAAVIASAAAVNSGAGLIKLAFPDKAYPAVTSSCQEKILLPLMTNNNGRISSQNIKKIEDELGKCDAVLIGCGMGCDHDTAAIAETVLKSSAVPVIIDADGINALKDNINVIKSCLSPVVITPHPGEAARILGCTVGEIEKDRKAACKAIFEKTGAVVVLKGSRTIVTANGIDFYVNLTGNPGMATAGSGDMLSGIILSFICQKIKPFSAAVCGVFVHGMAGDIVKSKYSMMGTTPTRMTEELPKILRSLEH